MRTRTPSVYFAGGEPTLRKDLPQLTRAAFELDYYPIFVNTNGSAVDRLLRKPSWSTWLADTDVVVVSLDGLDEAAMSAMWGYRKPRDVMRNLLLLRELAGSMRIKLMVNTVIQPGKVGLARDVLDLACDLGIWFAPVPMNTGPSIAGRLLDDPEYQALTEEILGRKRAGHRITGSLRMNQRLLGAHPLHCRNTLKPHVDHDGTLAWPCKASVNVMPAAIDLLAYDHLDQVWAEATERIDPTGFHGPAPEQCGGDCNWAQNYSTDAYVHGLEHPWSLLRDVGQLLGGMRVAT
jgi:MoaA/NifB/PqqE/SkfB family radical SAM enzyme